MRFAAATGSAFVAALFLLSSPARADLKIVSQVDVIGLAAYPGAQLFEKMAQSFPETITVYYKGDKARTDIPGGPSTIIDGAAGKIYTLFPDKTFTISSVKDAPNAQPDLFEQPGAPLSIKINLSKTEDVPGDSQVVAGFDAKKFLVTGTLQSTPPANRPNGGYRNGRRGMGRHGFHGGGFPGGGFPSLPLDDESYPGTYQRGSYPGAGARAASAVQVDGEVWLSGSVRLPGDKASLLPMLAPAFYFSGPLARSLGDPIKKTGELPLYTKVSLTHGAPGTDTSQTIVVTEQVQSVSTSPLPDSLFAIPPDYQQVASQPVVLSVGGGTAH